MPDIQRTLIAALLDRSGSMHSIESDTYAASAVGVGAAKASTTAYVSRKRSSAPEAVVPGFSEDDRAAARGGRR